ncbi:hypothetical protein PYW07_002890 [Mythimna separata]|uniref:Uncharacterized protein n=1 Tax=Mythimna separata TaxID=271217 RepID=A0AAD7YG47_MYTSE|nr:hypothetical protein PYW07_002890 [Mythimna separata]
MVARFLAFSALVAAATAVAVPVAKLGYAAPVANLAYAAPVAKLAYAAPVAKVAYEPAQVQYAPVAKLAYAQAQPEAPANYDFSYSVHDGQSGDVKQQQEARSGDNVQGSYSLVQPDGVQRIVDYTASEEHGFNAVVRKLQTHMLSRKLIAGYDSVPIDIEKQEQKVSIHPQE